MKKHLIIGITITIIICIIVSIGIWVTNIKKDKEATLGKMNEVVSNYNLFDKSVDDFSEVRNLFYKYKEDLYLETLSEKANDWNSFMDKYAESIKTVESKAKVLKEDCKAFYGDVNVNGKCITFKANYEAAHNYYISDVLLYNKLVDEYDKWNKEQGNKYPSVNKAKFAVYEKYIDFDNDGEYFGKSEVTENE